MTMDRARIVAAARGILERDGVEGLSMRRLAAALGSRPMTLYHYVDSKDTLLELVLTEIAAEIAWPDPDGPSRERMIAIVVAMHRELSAIPWIVPILRWRTTVGPAALVLVDRFITAALELGATETQAVSAWQACWYLVSSDIAQQTAPLAGGDSTPAWFNRLAPDQLDHAPQVAKLLPAWSQLAAHFNLETAINHQIDGAIATWE